MQTYLLVNKLFSKILLPGIRRFRAEFRNEFFVFSRTLRQQSESKTQWGCSSKRRQISSRPRSGCLIRLIPGRLVRTGVYFSCESIGDSSIVPRFSTKRLTKGEWASLNHALVKRGIGKLRQHLKCE